MYKSLILLILCTYYLLYHYNNWSTPPLPSTPLPPLILLAGYRTALRGVHETEEKDIIYGVLFIS